LIYNALYLKTRSVNRYFSYTSRYNQVLILSAERSYAFNRTLLNRNKKTTNLGRR